MFDPLKSIQIRVEGRLLLVGATVKSKVSPGGQNSVFQRTPSGLVQSM